MEGAILQDCPRLEIYNSHLTPNFGEWALGFCGGLYEKENPGGSEQTDHTLQSVTSLDLSNRCIHNLMTKVSGLINSLYHYCSFWFIFRLPASVSQTRILPDMNHSLLAFISGQLLEYSLFLPFIFRPFPLLNYQYFHM